MLHGVAKTGHDLVTEHQHSYQLISRLALVSQGLRVGPSLMKTPHCFEHCVFVGSLELGKCVSSLFFFKSILAIQGPLQSNMNLRIDISTSAKKKKKSWNFDQDCIEPAGHSR